MTKVKDLIIFDLDGTLIDSRDDIVHAINFTLRQLKLNEKAEEEIAGYIGSGVRELLTKSLGTENSELIEKALSIFTNYYKNHQMDTTRLYPDVKDILAHFNGKKKIVVTNRNYESASFILKSLNIRNYFDNILGGDDISCIKPSSCPLDKAISNLDINKDKAIMVGDMDIDVIAGQASGITTCAVTYGIGKEEDIKKAKPDFLINNIKELKDIIQ